MSTQQIRLLLKSLCLGSVLGVPLVLAWVCFAQVGGPNFEEAVATEPVSLSVTSRESITLEDISLEDFEIALSKPLQYPVGELEFDRRETNVTLEVTTPVRTKIVATIIESGQTAALFSTGGKLQVCRAGETIDEAKAEVVSIDAEKVVLKYRDELVTLDLPKTSNTHAQRN